MSPRGDERVLFLTRYSSTIAYIYELKYKSLCSALHVTHMLEQEKLERVLALEGVEIQFALLRLRAVQDDPTSQIIVDLLYTPGWNPTFSRCRSPPE